MDFIETITWYYNAEARHGLITSVITGIIFLAAGILVWWFSDPSTVFRGLVFPLVLGGLIFSIGGTIAGINAQKSLTAKVESYKANPSEFIESEFVKVENINKSWLGIRIFWSMFLLLGIIILFVTHKNIWVGIGLGSLILGTLGHIEESISYKHNEKYRLEVHQEKNRLNNIMR